MVLRDESVRESAFYAGAYDPGLVRLDYTLSDTVTPGELLVSAPGFTPAVGFTNPALVVTGAEDASLCNTKTGKTCEEILNSTRVLFPDSKRYGFYAPADTGHDIVLHFTAPRTFAAVHGWLDKVPGLSKRSEEY